ncbi:hypothetical protein FSP39_001123 [Pinctada imbricata]|uniref:Uncharacterized protein n=1 Tax=Pinctada imbricata TaxID=66713 RepID=A0AA89BLJ7_PINIB|nr:hypothetical protein FSP39_001123 [Pinctada imbricata]
MDDLPTDGLRTDDGRHAMTIAYLSLGLSFDEEVKEAYEGMLNAQKLQMMAEIDQICLQERDEVYRRRKAEFMADATRKLEAEKVRILSDLQRESKVQLDQRRKNLEKNYEILYIEENAKLKAMMRDELESQREEEMSRMGERIQKYIMKTEKALRKEQRHRLQLNLETDDEVLERLQQKQKQRMQKKLQPDLKVFMQLQEEHDRNLNDRMIDLQLELGTTIDKARQDMTEQKMAAMKESVEEFVCAEKKKLKEQAMLDINLSMLNDRDELEKQARLQMEREIAQKIEAEKANLEKILHEEHEKLKGQMIVEISMSIKKEKEALEDQARREMEEELKKNMKMVEEESTIKIKEEKESDLLSNMDNNELPSMNITGKIKEEIRILSQYVTEMKVLQENISKMSSSKNPNEDGDDSGDNMDTFAEESLAMLEKLRKLQEEIESTSKELDLGLSFVKESTLTTSEVRQDTETNNAAVQTNTDNPVEPIDEQASALQSNLHKEVMELHKSVLQESKRMVKDMLDGEKKDSHIVIEEVQKYGNNVLQDRTESLMAVIRKDMQTFCDQLREDLKTALDGEIKIHLHKRRQSRPVSRKSDGERRLRPSSAGRFKVEQSTRKQKTKDKIRKESLVMTESSTVKNSNVPESDVNKDGCNEQDKRKDDTGEKTGDDYDEIEEIDISYTDAIMSAKESDDETVCDDIFDESPRDRKYNAWTDAYEQKETDDGKEIFTNSSKNNKNKNNTVINAKHVRYYKGKFFMSNEGTPVNLSEAMSAAEKDIKTLVSETKMEIDTKKEGGTPTAMDKDTKNALKREDKSQVDRDQNDAPKIKVKDTFVKVIKESLAEDNFPSPRGLLKNAYSGYADGQIMDKKSPERKGMDNKCSEDSKPEKKGTPIRKPESVKKEKEEPVTKVQQTELKKEDTRTSKKKEPSARGKECAKPIEQNIHDKADKSGPSKKRVTFQDEIVTIQPKDMVKEEEHDVPEEKLPESPSDTSINSWDLDSDEEMDKAIKDEMQEVNGRSATENDGTNLDLIIMNPKESMSLESINSWDLDSDGESPQVSPQKPTTSAYQQTDNKAVNGKEAEKTVAVEPEKSSSAASVNSWDEDSDEESHAKADVKIVRKVYTEIKRDEKTVDFDGPKESGSMASVNSWDLDSDDEGALKASPHQTDGSAPKTADGDVKTVRKVYTEIKRDEKTVDFDGPKESGSMASVNSWDLDSDDEGALKASPRQTDGSTPKTADGDVKTVRKVYTEIKREEKTVNFDGPKESGSMASVNSWDMDSEDEEKPMAFKIVKTNAKLKDAKEADEQMIIGGPQESTSLQSVNSWDMDSDDDENKDDSKSNTQKPKLSPSDVDMDSLEKLENEIIQMDSTGPSSQSKVSTKAAMPKPGKTQDNVSEDDSLLKEIEEIYADDFGATKISGSKQSGEQAKKSKGAWMSTEDSDNSLMKLEKEIMGSDLEDAKGGIPKKKGGNDGKPKKGKEVISGLKQYPSSKSKAPDKTVIPKQDNMSEDDSLMKEIEEIYADDFGETKIPGSKKSGEQTKKSKGAWMSTEDSDDSLMKLEKEIMGSDLEDADSRSLKKKEGNTSKSKKKKEVTFAREMIEVNYPVKSSSMDSINSWDLDSSDVIDISKDKGKTDEDLMDQFVTEYKHPQAEQQTTVANDKEIQQGPSHTEPVKYDEFEQEYFDDSDVCSLAASDKNSNSSDDFQPGLCVDDSKVNMLLSESSEIGYETDGSSDEFSDDDEEVPNKGKKAKKEKWIKIPGIGSVRLRSFKEMRGKDKEKKLTDKERELQDLEAKLAYEEQKRLQRERETDLELQKLADSDDEDDEDEEHNEKKKGMVSKLLKKFKKDKEDGLSTSDKQANKEEKEREKKAKKEKEKQAKKEEKEAEKKKKQELLLKREEDKQYYAKRMKEMAEMIKERRKEIKEQEKMEKNRQKQIKEEQKKAKSKEPKAKSKEPKAKSKEPKAKSKEPKAKSKEPKSKDKKDKKASKMESKDLDEATAPVNVSNTGKLDGEKKAKAKSKKKKKVDDEKPGEISEESKSDLKIEIYDEGDQTHGSEEILINKETVKEKYEEEEQADAQKHKEEQTDAQMDEESEDNEDSTDGDDEESSDDSSSEDEKELKKDKQKKKGISIGRYNFRFGIRQKEPVSKELLQKQCQLQELESKLTDEKEEREKRKKEIEKELEVKNKQEDKIEKQEKQTKGIFSKAFGKGKTNEEKEASKSKKKEKKEKIKQKLEKEKEALKKQSKKQEEFSKQQIKDINKEIKQKKKEIAEQRKKDKTESKQKKDTSKKKKNIDSEEHSKEATEDTVNNEDDDKDSVISDLSDKEEELSRKQIKKMNKEIKEKQKEIEKQMKLEKKDKKQMEKEMEKQKKIDEKETKQKEKEMKKEKKLKEKERKQKKDASTKTLKKKTNEETSDESEDESDKHEEECKTKTETDKRESASKSSTDKSTKSEKKGSKKIKDEEKVDETKTVDEIPETNKSSDESAKIERKKKYSKRKEVKTGKVATKSDIEKEDKRKGVKRSSSSESNMEEQHSSGKKIKGLTNDSAAEKAVENVDSDSDLESTDDSISEGQVIAKKGKSKQWMPNLPRIKGVRLRKMSLSRSKSKDDSKAASKKSKGKEGKGLSKQDDKKEKDSKEKTKNKSSKDTRKSKENTENEDESASETVTSEEENEDNEEESDEEDKIIEGSKTGKKRKWLPKKSLFITKKSEETIGKEKLSSLKGKKSPRVKGSPRGKTSPRCKTSPRGITNPRDKITQKSKEKTRREDESSSETDTSEEENQDNEQETTEGSTTGKKRKWLPKKSLFITKKTEEIKSQKQKASGKGKLSSPRGKKSPRVKGSPRGKTSPRGKISPKGKISPRGKVSPRGKGSPRGKEESTKNKLEGVSSKEKSSKSGPENEGTDESEMETVTESEAGNVTLKKASNMMNVNEEEQDNKEETDVDDDAENESDTDGCQDDDGIIYRTVDKGVKIFFGSQYLVKRKVPNKFDIQVRKQLKKEAEREKKIEKRAMKAVEKEDKKLAKEIKKAKKEQHKEEKQILNETKKQEKEKIKLLQKIQRQVDERDTIRRIEEIKAQRRGEHVQHDNMEEDDDVVSVRSDETTRSRDTGKRREESVKSKDIYQKSEESVLSKEVLKTEKKLEKKKKRKLKKLEQLRNQRMLELRSLQKRIGPRLGLTDEDLAEDTESIGETASVDTEHQEDENKVEASSSSDYDTELEEGYRPTKPKCIVDIGLLDENSDTSIPEVIFNQNVDESDVEFSGIYEPAFEKMLRKKKRKERKEREKREIEKREARELRHAQATGIYTESVMEILNRRKIEQDPEKKKPEKKQGRSQGEISRSQGNIQSSSLSMPTDKSTTASAEYIDKQKVVKDKQEQIHVQEPPVRSVISLTGSAAPMVNTLFVEPKKKSKVGKMMKSVSKHIFRKHGDVVPMLDDMQSRDVSPVRPTSVIQLYPTDPAPTPAEVPNKEPEEPPKVEEKKEEDEEPEMTTAQPFTVSSDSEDDKHRFGRETVICLTSSDTSSQMERITKPPTRRMAWT